MTRHLTSEAAADRRSLLRRLLRRHLSVARMAGCSVAAMLGLVIIMMSVQVYRDVSHSMSNDADTLFGRNYIVVSKRVTALGALTGEGAGGFTASEREDLARQPWARETGDFTAADFDVVATADLGGRRLTTALFLESVPDAFCDVMPPQWRRYREGSGMPVPVIIPADYLSLYNYGYAASRGLPRVSREMMGLLPLRLSLSGNGVQETVDARIVGFSSRLNTIAVPGAFLAWANRRYGRGAPAAPSRLIVKVTDPADAAVDEYLRRHGLERNADGGTRGQMSGLVGAVTLAGGIVGVTICVLSCIILLLSVYLLLQKERGRIHRLMQLGYAPGSISAAYTAPLVGVIAVMWGCATGVFMVLRGVWAGVFADLGLGGCSPWLTLGVGAALGAAMVTVTVTAIRHRVSSSFRLRGSGD